MLLKIDNPAAEFATGKPFYTFNEMHTRGTRIPGTEAHAEAAESLGTDSLHKIAALIAADETLDEVLASTMSIIASALGCHQWLTHVLQGEKFEPWIWKASEPRSEPALNPDLAAALARYKVPVAISEDSGTNHPMRVFKDWATIGETSIAVPLLFRARLVGVISLRHQPRIYAEREVKILATIGLIIGADIAVSLAQAENAVLREELEMRKLVDRGKGILQRDLRVSEQQAYVILETLSRQKGKPIKEIARVMILGDEVKRGAAVG